MTKALLILGLLFVTEAALANCKLPESPLIPDGSTASELEMQSAKIAVKAFAAELIDYRSCLDKKIANLQTDPEGYTKTKLEKKYNESVDIEEYVVNTFNLQLKLFKSKQETP